MPAIPSSCARPGTVGSAACGSISEGNLVSGRPPRTGWRGFADRLSPLERWVDRHVGRAWSNVYREFCERFDRRTTKGWHLEDHLLDMVGRARFTPGAKFLVDDRGILRRRPPGWFQMVDKSWEETPRALAWAAGRRVIVRGETLFWTARVVDALAPTSPQGRRLAPEEVDFWSSLSPNSPPRVGSSTPCP